MQYIIIIYIWGIKQAYSLQVSEKVELKVQCCSFTCVVQKQLICGPNVSNCLC